MLKSVVEQRLELVHMALRDLHSRANFSVYTEYDDSLIIVSAKLQDRGDHRKFTMKKVFILFEKGRWSLRANSKCRYFNEKEYYEYERGMLVPIFSEFNPFNVREELAARILEQ